MENSACDEAGLAFRAFDILMMGKYLDCEDFIKMGIFKHLSDEYLLCEQQDRLSSFKEE